MDIMTTKQAAKFLKVSERTVFRLIQRNSIKAEKFGPVWMIDKDSVVDYQRRNEGKEIHDPTRA